MNATLTRSVLPAAAVLLLCGAYLVGPGQGPEVVGHPVAGSVSYLIGPGAGNIGVQTGADGILVIDDQFEAHAASIEAALAKLGKGVPKFLINTHWHGDHTGGNAHFGRTATILAHANVRRRLEGDGTIGGTVSGDELPAVALPVVTFEDGVSLHFNGEEVRLLHLPNAHTDGDTAVWFTGSNVIHMGDLYFQVGYPYLDVESGGGITGMIAAVETILALVPADVKVIPGHGETTGLDGLREYLAMLQTIDGRVRELAAAGFSVDEMLESGVTEDYDERWSWGFIDGRRFVTSVLASQAR